jgi:hypothetical protein
MTVLRLLCHGQSSRGPAKGYANRLVVDEPSPSDPVHCKQEYIKQFRQSKYLSLSSQEIKYLVL